MGLHGWNTVDSSAREYKARDQRDLSARSAGFLWELQSHYEIFVVSWVLTGKLKESTHMHTLCGVHRALAGLQKGRVS